MFPSHVTYFFQSPPSSFRVDRISFTPGEQWFVLGVGGNVLPKTHSDIVWGGLNPACASLCVDEQ